MTLVPLPDLLGDARTGKYAVGYFEAWDVYSLEAVIAAAEAERSPVIIGIGGLSAEHSWLQNGGIEIYGAVCETLARRSRMPIATLWNEAESFSEAAAGLRAGFNAVMIHTHGWETERVLTETRALVAAAHGVGVAVEGEVGQLAEMREGEVDEDLGEVTTPEEAVEFVAQTGVDCLSVAVGNVHFVTAGYTPSIRVDRIREVSQVVDVPLVLHGGSGTPPDQMQAAIAAGITKINVGTRLKEVFGTAVREALAGDEDDPNILWGSRFPGDVLRKGGEALTADVIRLMQVFGSSGRVGA
ncbi:MAG: fructose-bisphosphate aldolase, class [Gaiellaceae bacterium]|nr:fructose-bisphosphate aldolase, class [Gaiellaceae bacterium]